MRVMRTTPLRTTRVSRSRASSAAHGMALMAASRRRIWGRGYGARAPPAKVRGVHTRLWVQRSTQRSTQEVQGMRAACGRSVAQGSPRTLRTRLTVVSAGQWSQCTQRRLHLAPGP